MEILCDESRPGLATEPFRFSGQWRSRLFVLLGFTPKLNKHHRNMKDVNTLCFFGLLPIIQNIKILKHFFVLFL